jgi:hypothetical protein
MLETRGGEDAGKMPALQEHGGGGKLIEVAKNGAARYILEVRQAHLIE